MAPCGRSPWETPVRLTPRSRSLATAGRTGFPSACGHLYRVKRTDDDRVYSRGLPGLVVVLDREQPTKRQKVTALPTKSKPFLRKPPSGRREASDVHPIIQRALQILAKNNWIKLLLLLLATLYGTLLPSLHTLQ